MIRAFNQISRTAAILAGVAAPIVLVTAIPAVAQLELLPQRPAQSPVRPPQAPGQTPGAAPGQPAAPSAAQIGPQLESCQNWVSRALTNVPRSNINVSPHAGTSVGGIIDIDWRIQDGTERGLCRVRRNGSILEGVRSTPSGLIHYFPANPNEVGDPIQ